MTPPTAEDAALIAHSVMGEAAVSCERFTTGLRNWVYDVKLASGERVVVRMSDPDNRAELDGGLFWSELLSERGIGVARVLGHDTAATQPYVVLERFGGTDLGNVFTTLGDDDLAAIADSVAAMQRQTAQLPTASGYGYALSYDSPVEPTWLAVVNNEVDRAERWIRGAGVVDPKFVDVIRTDVSQHHAQLNQVAPRAFLHDATTKNVIVDAGRVTGLVDVDTMAFGDPLWAVALTRVSLLAAGHATTYADLLAAAMAVQNLELLDLYTRIFGLTFLGEIGQSFNRDEPAPIDHELRLRLEALLRPKTTRAPGPKSEGSSDS